MKHMDLSENITVLGTDRGIAVLDARDALYQTDIVSMPLRVANPDRSQTVHAALCLLLAARLLPEGRIVPVERVTLDYPHEVYAQKVLAGTAAYADGAEEDWRIQVDPLKMRINWVRQPEHPAHPLLYVLVVPLADGALQFWHTGGGEWAVSRPELGTSTIHSPGETEALFYAEGPRNCFRVELPLSGLVDISMTTAAAQPIADALGDAIPAQQRLWRAAWTSPPSAISQCSLSWGIAGALHDFHGRIATRMTDASLDFGPFYAQATLGGFSLNIHGDGKVPLGLRPHALPLQKASDAHPARTLAFVADFLHLLAPEALAVLMEPFLAQTTPQEQPKGNSSEDAAARLLVIARAEELYGTVSASPSILDETGLLLERLLEQCVASQGLPVRHEAEETPLFHAGYAARCYRALRSWAEIMHANERHHLARRCAETAQRILDAARRPIEDGGLWHPRYSVFVSRHVQEGAHNPEATLYDHRAHLDALHCGLCQELREVQRGFDWLDDAFSYASGRAAPTFPPHGDDMATLLLDAYIRHRWGLASASTLLQYASGHAMDRGLPFPDRLVSLPDAHAEGTDPPIATATCGSLAALAPWLGLVLQQHYGLEYSVAGWRIGQPNPLPGYPLTRLTNLAHGRATFAITWQGRGRLRRISVNGMPHDTPCLNATVDRHEVVVYLG